MIVLGIFAHGQNPAAALVIDGKLIAMVEEERYTRFKVSAGMWPTSSMTFCLKQAGITFADVDEIAFAWDAPRYTSSVPLGYARAFLKNREWKLPRPWKSSGLDGDEASDARASGVASVIEGALNVMSCHPEHLKELTLQSVRATGWFGKVPPLVFYPHHLCHAASAFFCSGYEDAAVLTMDGHGEITCTELFDAQGRTIRSLWKKEVPSSLGWYYSAFTEFVGFKPYEEEGKLMGLAPYGAPSALQRDGGRGHIQSLILTAILATGGTFLVLLALIADLISVNRKLLEKVDHRLADIEDHLEVRSFLTHDASGEVVPAALTSTPA